MKEMKVFAAFLAVLAMSGCEQSAQTYQPEPIAIMVALVSAGTAMVWAILRANDEYNPYADMGAEDKE